jgi:hypothetical protein
MRNFIGFIFCLFIALQGPWAFIPNDNLTAFLVRNTELSAEVAPFITYEWGKFAEESEDGYIFISYEAFQKVNKEYLRQMSEIEKKEKKQPAKDLSKKIDNLIEKLEE